MNPANAIPVWERYTLSVEEAAAYFRIGENKLRRIVSENQNADFKGGVDFPTVWHQKCRMCFEEQSTLELLTELTEELERRKQLLTVSGQPNIDRYNETTGENLTRYIFACDEVA